MIRQLLRSECTNTGERYKIEIHDSTYSGDPTYYTGADNVFTLSHQQITPQTPYAQNIQQGQCSVSMYVDDNLLIDDILSEPEGTFKIKIFKYPLSFANTYTNNVYDDFIQVEDFSLACGCIKGGIGTLEAVTFIDDFTTGDSIYWQGYVLPDLCNYQNSFSPFKLDIVAKDFLYTKRQFYGSDFAFTYGRKSLFNVIYTILRDEFEIKFRSITNFAADDSGDEYLEKVYIDDSTLRDYGNEGTGGITKFEALQRILQSNNLVVKQTDGKWYVTQYSAMSTNIVDEFQASGTVTGSLSTSVNIGQNPSNITVDSIVGSVSPVGTIQGRYLHRTRVSTISIPSYVQLDVSQTPLSYTSDITTDTDSHTLTITGNISANTGSPNTPSVKAYILIKYGNDYWDGSTWSTYSSGAGITIELSKPAGYYTVYSNTVSIETDFIPAGDKELSVTLYRAEKFTLSGLFDGYASFNDLSIIGKC